jgi:hypothetical protein
MFLYKSSRCHPETTFLSPEANFLCRPEPLSFVTPSGSEGSLGTCVPRDDKKGSVPRENSMGGSRPETTFLSPEANFLCRPEPLSFVTPSGSEGSPWGRRPEGSVLWDTVPNKVRDASLSLGMTIKRTLGRTRKRSLGKTRKRTLGRTKKQGLGRIKYGDLKCSNCPKNFPCQKAF